MWRIPLIILLLIAIIIIGILYYIKPTKTLNLSYTEVSWQDKLGEILESRQPVISLTEDDINNLAKKEIVEHTLDSPKISGIQGANFELDGQILIADIIGKWGPIRAEASAVYEMSFQNGKLLITPKSILVRNHSISPSLFGLQPIKADPNSYLPNIVKISAISFEQKELKIKLAINL